MFSEMKKSSWFLICEWDFAIMGTLAGYAGAPPHILIWLGGMCFWMMKKVFEELKKEK